MTNSCRFSSLPVSLYTTVTAVLALRALWNLELVSTPTSISNPLAPIPTCVAGDFTTMHRTSRFNTSQLLEGLEVAPFWQSAKCQSLIILLSVPGLDSEAGFDPLSACHRCVAGSHRYNSFPASFSNPSLIRTLVPLLFFVFSITRQVLTVKFVCVFCQPLFTLGSLDITPILLDITGYLVDITA